MTLYVSFERKRYRIHLLRYLDLHWFDLFGDNAYPIMFAVLPLIASSSLIQKYYLTYKSLFKN